MQYALGVDIGGTKISVIAGNAQGQVYASRLLSTRTGKKTRQGIEELTLVLRELKNSLRGNGRLRGVGVGIPGPMNPEKGVVERSPHLNGWQGIHLKSLLEKRLRVPVAISNDANAAALGEKVFGAGKKVQDFIYLTISTGIGGGIIVKGELVNGVNFVGGEVGHTTIVPGGDACKCGKRGCLEAYASGTAIARFVESRRSKNKSSRIWKLIPQGKKVTAQIVGKAAKLRDKLALEAYRRAGYYLGIGIANLLNVLNPERVVLGGGVLKSAPKDFWNSMIQSCKREAWPQAYRSVKIVRSKLGDRTGDLGALALVFNQK